MRVASAHADTKEMMSSSSESYLASAAKAATPAPAPPVHYTLLVEVRWSMGRQLHVACPSHGCHTARRPLDQDPIPKA